MGVSFYSRRGNIEFAEEYSKAERNKRVLFFCLLGAFIIITHEKWVFPFITWYGNTAHCHNPFGYSGISVMLYSITVGIPLFCAFLFGVPLIPLGLKGLIHGQFPPKGMKVYKPTKIIRGWKAKVISIFNLLVPVLFVGISIWGYFQVDEIPRKALGEFDYSVCKS